MRCSNKTKANRRCKRKAKKGRKSCGGHKRLVRKRRSRKTRKRKTRKRRNPAQDALIIGIEFWFDGKDEHWNDKTLDRALQVVKTSITKLAKRLKLEVRGL